MNDEEIEELITALMELLPEFEFDWVLSDVSDAFDVDRRGRRQFALSLVDGLAAATSDLAAVEERTVTTLRVDDMRFRPADGTELPDQEVGSEGRRARVRELLSFQSTIESLRRDINGA